MAEEFLKSALLLLLIQLRLLLPLGRLSLLRAEPLLGGFGFTQRCEAAPRRALIQGS